MRKFALCLLLATPIAAQMDHDHHHGTPERLGNVAFPVSCSNDVQAQFTRAVALLHSFWYAQSEKSFREIATKDPQCGMAWWGAAMSDYH